MVKFKAAFCSAFVVLLTILVVPPAQATVIADQVPEPAWGVDGRVYATLVAGDTVYVGGTFANAVSPTGQLVPRQNLAAFSLGTGELLTSWRLDSNGVVRALATDGRSLYIGGAFGQLGGMSRPRLGKADLASAALDGSFRMQIDGNVRALAVSGGSVYAGGSFTAVSGHSRARLVKVDAGSGAVDLNFAASADDSVYAMAVDATTKALYVGGKFNVLGGATRAGVGAVNTDTGAVTPLILASATTPTYALDLSDDGRSVFTGTAANVVGAWDTRSGSRLWRHYTEGDVQALDYHRGMLYFGFHDAFEGDTSLRLLAADGKTGALDPDFRPSFDRFWGVFAIDAEDAGIAIGGEFDNVTNVTARNVARFLPSGTLPAEPVVTPYLDVNTPWSYWDKGTRPAAWESPSFDDSQWPRGAPQLGYGDGDETTPIYRGPANAYMTAYFRAGVQIDSMPESVMLSILADDGAVVYVNGTEAVRDNMPTGAVTMDTPAASERSGGAENTFRTFEIPASLLRVGPNVIAVEVHQYSRYSSDLSFDMQLNGTSAATTSNPPNAVFTVSGDRLTLSFDGTSSSDSDGTISDYAWTFGDGSTASGPVVEHTYASGGSYTVTLTVTDDAGSIDTATSSVTAVSSTLTETVVPLGSNWHWRYASTAPDPNWKMTDNWQSGIAPFGWGSARIATNIDTYAVLTERPRAAYFSREFVVADPTTVQRLSLRTVGDDGVVVHVNGIEVGRDNMGAGTPTFDTYAETARSTSTAWANMVTIDVPPTLLRPGTNRVAVETHLNFRRTRDLSFDLQAVLTTLR